MARSLIHSLVMAVMFASMAYNFELGEAMVIRSHRLQDPAYFIYYVALSRIVK